MMDFNLKEEMSILEKNYYNQLKIQNDLNNFGRSPFTFREDNWILTFPFNFYNNKSRSSLELIRKLSIINSSYGLYFFAEDNIIDDYNCSQNEFREIIIKFIKSHSLKNLAIGQLIHLCGQKIYEYIYDYEDKYYRALHFEKTMKDISLNNMLNETNLLFLGHKIMPLGVVYAAFCIDQNELEKIPLCENLIINYHIAKQLYDDIIDLNEDIQKPDLSYLIKACKINSTDSNFCVDSVKQTLIYNNYYGNYFNTIHKYLENAENIAKKMNFILFMKEIVALKRKIDFMRIKMKS